MRRREWQDAAVASDELLASWRRTQSHFERALGSLTSTDDEALAWYRGFLEHNELGLAFDVLVELVERQRAPRGAWEALRQAADEMELGADHEVHGGSRRRVEAHLSAGAEWFELQRLLNQWDPIGVYDPETNFPDDEYDCLYQPLMSRLRAGQDAATIASFLQRELRQHFGLDPGPSKPEVFARRLVAWFHGRS